MGNSEPIFLLQFCTQWMQVKKQLLFFIKINPLKIKINQSAATVYWCINSAFLPTLTKDLKTSLPVSIYYSGV